MNICYLTHQLLLTSALSDYLAQKLFSSRKESGSPSTKMPFLRLTNTKFFCKKKKKKNTNTKFYEELR